MTVRPSVACAAFWLLFTSHIIAVWLPAHFVTHDGPSHLDNAGILLRYDSSPVYRQYLRVNLKPFPNWFGHIAEGVLLVAFRPAIAEKLFITGYVVLFPLVVWWTVRTMRREAQWNAVLVFPLVFNCLLQYGFLNYCWSICLFLLLTTYWYTPRRPGFRHWTVGASFAVLLYFTHVFSWVMCLLMTGIISLRIGSRERWWRRAAVALSSFLPSGILVAWFMWSQALASNAAGVPVGFGQRWQALWRASTVVSSYSPEDVAISTAFGLLLLGLAALAILRRRFNLWALFTTLAIAGYFASPPQSGIGQYVLERWNLYALLGASLWIAVETRGRLAAYCMIAGALIVSCANLNVLCRRQRDLNVQLAQYLSLAPAIQSGSTLLPIHFDSRGPGELRSLYGFPLRHAAHYLGVERRVLVLDNYEAQTGVFPLVFNDALNPGVHIGRMEDEPPAPEFADFPAKTGGGQVDYVLLWDPLHQARAASGFSAIQAQLDRRYTLIRSSTNGAALLYGLR